MDKIFIISDVIKKFSMAYPWLHQSTNNNHAH